MRTNEKPMDPSLDQATDRASEPSVQQQLLIARYRYVAREAPSPAIDAAVLAHARYVARSRRRAGALAMAASVCGAALLSLIPHSRGTESMTPLHAERLAGYDEGRARAFLLQQSGTVQLASGKSETVSVLLQHDARPATAQHPSHTGDEL